MLFKTLRASVSGLRIARPDVLVRTPLGIGSHHRPTWQIAAHGGPTFVLSKLKMSLVLYAILRSTNQQEDT